MILRLFFKNQEFLFCGRCALKSMERAFLEIWLDKNILVKLSHKLSCCNSLLKLHIFII